jgi:hypothetical protein
MAREKSYHNFDAAKLREMEEAAAYLEDDPLLEDGIYYSSK